MQNFIEIEDLTFWYENHDLAILKDINLTVRQGEFVAIVGSNGSGKSTLIRHLNGLLTPSRGKVSVGGIDTREESRLPEIRRSLGMVFQNPDTQLFASVVEEDVAFGPENLCLSPTEINARVVKALSQVGMLEYRQHPPHCLSGGQKQKVAIAGILAMEPQCIILDEPTSMLDPKGKKEVIDAIVKLNKDRNITLVYVTHDMAEALLAERIIVLAGGMVSFSGPPAEFFSSTQLMKATEMSAPPIVELVTALRSEGVKLPEKISSVEELVDAL